MADIAIYAAESMQAQNALDTAVAKAKSSTWLTPVAQAAEADKATAAYQARVADIQARAETDLTAQRSTIVSGLAKIREAEAKAERDVVGPEIQFHLFERRMAKATPEELVKWLDSARDPWEKAVVSQIGESLLPVNVAIDDPRLEAVRRFQSRTQAAADPTIAKLEAALRQVDAGLGTLKQLDPIGYQRYIRETFHLREPR